jgi:hypothetical protein
MKIKEFSKLQNRKNQVSMILIISSFTAFLVVLQFWIQGGISL